MNVEDRREYINQQITLWVGNLRLDAALAAEELGQYSGMQKALLLRNGLLVGAVRHCRLNPRADTRMSILTLITFLADNNDGICRLSVTRMCEIFTRSRESIVTSIASLEEDGQIGVNRSGGMPSCYWPLIPAALAELSANPVWFVDALSTKPKFRSFGTPEEAIAAATQDRSTPLDQSTPPDQYQSGDLTATGQLQSTNRSTLVDALVRNSRAVSLFLTQLLTQGERPARCNRAQRSAKMNTALGGEAAYAESNIFISPSGKLTIGEEFRAELREAFTDSQI